MSKLWIVLGAVALFLLIVVGSAVGMYNSLVAEKTQVDNQWAQVENQLKRRADLVPNLVATVKGASAHETEVVTAVTTARAKLAGATNPADAAVANNELSGALSRLLVVVEAYPDIKANQNFLSLQAQLEGTENRITVARQDYNNTVTVYNTHIKSFPAVMFAGMFGFEKAALFEIAPADTNVPTVNF